MACAVHVARLLRLLVQVERIGGGGLHAKRRLHGLDAALQRVVDAAARGEMLAVQLIHEIELPALIGVLDPRIVQPRDHLLRIEVRVIDIDALMLRGQKRAAPQDAENAPAAPGKARHRRAGFRFSLPRPYDNHEPMLGTRSVIVPLFMSSSAGP